MTHSQAIRALKKLEADGDAVCGDDAPVIPWEAIDRSIWAIETLQKIRDLADIDADRLGVGFADFVRELQKLIEVPT